MASGTINVEGYKAGETASFTLRSFGRVTNNGQNIYTYVITDKPVLATSCSSIVVPSSINIYRVGHTTSVSLDTSRSAVFDRVNKNVISFQIPITPTVSAGLTYFMETLVTVTFS